MNNLNITQNSNDLNESEKTQEKLYSNEASLDDLLTYSDDASQNQSTNRLPANIKNKNKEEKIKDVIDLSNKKQIPVISSFNSEVTMSFLNSQNANNLNNKEYQSKSASKSISKNNKSCSDFKSISSTKSHLFDMNKNLKDISEIHVSLSNLLSDFEIKDISMSKSINENTKKNKSEKKNHNLNPISNNNNCLSIRSENLFAKKKEKSISNNQVSSGLNLSNEISVEHSNTNSMCNYQNISNLNDLSINLNNQKNIIKKKEKEKSEKEKSDNNINLFIKNEIGDIKNRLNLSIDNCNDKTYKNEKNKYFGGVIDETEINKKDNFTTSNKKENNLVFSNKNAKIIKNSLKYTKAQCINNLMENNEYNKNNKIEQYSQEIQISPKRISSPKNQNINNQKIINFSPHKQAFEIEKNDCIQISINGKCKSNEELSKDFNNIIYFNNQYSTLDNNNKLNDFNIDNNLFYFNENLKKNNTTSFMISPNQNNNITNYQKNNLNNKRTYINNKNINAQKADANIFFYNPKNKIINNKINKKSENELQTPDLNKNKMTPMTCIHKGSLVYCTDNYYTNNNNTIQINKINDGSNSTKVSHYSFSKNLSKNSNQSNINKSIKPLNHEKKLGYLKSHNYSSKSKQSIMKVKNNSFIKTNNNECFNINNKKDGDKKVKLKLNEKEFPKKKQLIYKRNNTNKNNNSKIRKNLNIRNNVNINNNNSINNKKNISSKIKITPKNKTIIDEINKDLIKESSLFCMLYNNMSQKGASKNNSRKSSNDKTKEEKETTIIHKKENFTKMMKKDEKNSKNKVKNLLDINLKNKSQKKLVKHNTNNSFSAYNTILAKALDESNKINKVQKKKNVETKKKLSFNKIIDNKNKVKKIEEKIKNISIASNENKKKEIHKKVKTQINLNSFTSNFNFINEKRRKNNKSLYNFGNIYFINQNQIIKNDYDTINPHNNENIGYIINSINNKNIKSKENNIKKRIIKNNEIKKKINENLKLKKEKNPLNRSNAKQNPKIIMDFSKYKRKADYRSHFASMVDQKNLNLNEYNIYNPEYNETQLISEKEK